MNAQSPALVASRPERLRLVGQRRLLLAVMHQRLMFAMLLFAGLVALILSKHPGLSPFEVKAVLASVADNPGRRHPWRHRADAAG